MLLYTVARLWPQDACAAIGVANLGQTVTGTDRGSQQLAAEPPNKACLIVCFDNEAFY